MFLLITNPINCMTSQYATFFATIANKQNYLNQIRILTLEDIIPIDKYSIPKRLEKLLGYICNNIVALRTMQRFLEEQDEEYSEYVRAILDTAMNIVEEVYGEGEDVW